MAIKMVSLRIRDGDYSFLQDRADSMGISTSGLVRMILREWIVSHKETEVQ
jgi:antitoxin component of RelBE/YafQ-DinJ toxin-antitoxin module